MRNWHAAVLGLELNKFECPWYMASWLLSLITVPAATPPYPQQHTGGTHKGLTAPLPTRQRAARSSPSLAGSPSPVCLTIKLSSLAPSHPQLNMGGSQQGLMALSPISPREVMPSTSLATSSVPAHLMPTSTHPSKGSSSAPTPPTTTGEAAPAAKHRAATTLVCWVRCTWLRCRFTQQRRTRLQAF
jgi:hypothetical protein